MSPVQLGLILSTEGANPLVPNGWEVTLLVVMALHVVPLIMLVVWLLRTAELTAIQRLLGLLVGLALPVLGPLLAWLVLRREVSPGR